MKVRQVKSIGGGGPYPSLQLTSTKSEDRVNAGLQSRTRRKKSNGSDRNLIVLLFATALVSVILFVYSFKLVHDSRPATSEYIRPMKTIRKNRKEIIPHSVEQKHKKDSKLSKRGRNSNKAAKKNVIEKKINQELTEEDVVQKDGKQSNKADKKNVIKKKNNQELSEEDVVQKDGKQSSAEKAIKKKHEHEVKKTAATEMVKNAPIHEGFEVIESKYLPTHLSTVHIYKHKKTHAQFMAYVPEDDTVDKVFAISFRTKPKSDNGVAHILEHSVLCGSKKYPAKDPFLILRKGSLNTFLNAMTFSDRTVYPLASLNKRDFQNLMGVYLDAVFAPKCVTEEGDWVLQQEGWRYDVDEKDKLQLKGIVYSEMKGVFSNPTSLMMRSADKFLFPNNTYYFDSGGEPSAIPTLTQEEFVHFYHQHYHPSNSQSFVSGTEEDIMNAMDMIDGYMKEYEHKPELKEESAIEYQKKSYSKPVHEKMSYAVQKIDDSEGQHMLSITWLLNDDALSLDLKVTLNILNHLLVGSSSAPLVKRLSESGLGKSVIGGGVNLGLLQGTFCIGMKGVKESDVVHVEALIFQIFNDIVRNGFTKDEIEATLNLIEFQLREVHSSSTPAGIGIFLGMLTEWNYDKNPLELFEYDSALTRVRKEIEKKESAFFAGIIELYLLQNNHRVHVQLNPDENLSERMIKDEEEYIQKHQENLKDGELEAIKERASHLKKVQTTNDPLSVVNSIPHLEISDMNPSGAEYEVDVVNKAYGTSAELTKHVVNSSNGIVYADVGIDISRIDYSDMQLLPFVVSMMHESDTTTNTRLEINTMVGMHTGGIGIDLELLPVFEKGQTEFHASDSKKLRSVLFFGGKCTSRNVNYLFNLIADLAQNSLPVKKEKAIEIIERKISAYKGAMSSRGHSYSARKLHSKYDTYSLLLEKLTGIDQLQFLQSILDGAKTDWEAFEKRIINMMKSFSEMRSMDTVIHLTSDAKTLAEIDGDVGLFVKSLKDDPDGPQIQKFQEIDHPWMVQGAKERSKISFDNDGIPIPSRVSYVGKGGILFDKGEKISGGSSVVLEYLKKGYLWEKVRAKNGAYGVTASLSNRDGTIYMVSYRDPQLHDTLNIFDDAGKHLKDELEQKAITDQALRAAIIGTIGSLDGPSLPPGNAGSLAFKRFLGGSTKALRQKWREEILSTTLDDFHAFADKLMSWKNRTAVVLSSDAAIAKVGEKIPFNILNIA